MQFGKRNQDEVVQNQEVVVDTLNAQKFYDFPMQFGKQSQDEVVQNQHILVDLLNAHEFGGKTKVAKRKMDFWPHTPKSNKRKRMGSAAKANFKISGIQWEDIEGSIIHLC